MIFLITEINYSVVALLLWKMHYVLLLFLSQSTFFAFLMAVPLEPTIDSLDDAVIRTPRIHFCGGKFTVPLPLPQRLPQYVSSKINNAQVAPMRGFFRYQTILFTRKSMSRVRSFKYFSKKCPYLNLFLALASKEEYG